MDAGRWREIERLYHAALEREPEERGEFILKACTGDAELRNELESLLAQDLKERGPLDGPAWEGAASLLDSGKIRRLSAGVQLGPYRIEKQIGAGGMGEVYRARDTRLGRDVALKVLPAEVAGDPARCQRFELEARAVAALNHPNIVAIHDVGNENGVSYMVTELVDGDSLRSGRFSHRKALDIAVQIVDGLAAAHAAGVSHRDLKPENILVTREGRVKILDFGLAKFTVRSVASGTESLTVKTEPGVVMGTVQYMSPEQARGEATDHRSDLFSFGVIFYELLSGKRPFQADTAAGTIAAILNQDPPELPDGVSQLVRHIVTLCLEKNRDARWHSAHDLKLELIWAKQEFDRPALVSKTRRRESIAWGVALTVLVASVLLAIGYARNRALPGQAVRSSLLAPPKYYFQPGNFSVSPDGTRLAFVAVAPDGGYSLWVRTLSSSVAQQLSGTEGASFPFWSPDSKRAGFLADGKLKTVDLASGAVRIISEAPSGHSAGSWNRDGSILFEPFASGPLYRVAETGGAPVAVSSLRFKKGGPPGWPFFLPDGNHFLYAFKRSTPDDPLGNGIYIGSIRDGAGPRPLVPVVSENAAFASGYLLYGENRSLRAQPFDPERLQLSGNSFSVAEQELEEDPGFSHSEFSVSENGVIVFQSLNDSVSRLMWFDRSGSEVGQIAESGYKDPRISPSGRFVAVSSDDARNGKFFIRVYDTVRGTSTRLTEGGGEESPAWTPDGENVTYAGFDGKSFYLSEVAIDGTRPSRLLWKGSGIMRQLDWSPDGHLAFADFTGGLPNLKVYSASDHQVATIGPAAEARFSPDGRWIAYAQASAEHLTQTGGMIFIQPFPGPGGRIAISTGEAAQPAWSHDGRQIFYIAPDRKLMAVDFDPEKRSAGAPRVLFQTRIIAPNFIGTQLDVSRDGRFLINSVPPGTSSALTLLTGWTAQLKR